MAHSLQGVYAPLPQSLSDSDSEKEVCMEPICPNNGTKNLETNNFASRQNGHFMGFNNINEDVHKVKRINPKMSTPRKAAFVFSILLCFIPIIIFLWVLPCSETNTCPIKISNWETEQSNIEFQGPIHLVHGAFKNHLNLALMYRGSLNTSKVLKNGIISFVGKNGVVAWDFQQEIYPLEMNCSIIDVNSDGYDDCLVVDEKGLKVIETLSGEALWHAHSAQERFIPELDMPVKLKDFNNDGISELLVIYKKESFLVISGRDGIALLNIKIPSFCVSIENLTSCNEYIRYFCRASQTSSFFQIHVSEVEAKLKNPRINIIPKKIIMENKQKFMELGNHKLFITNNDSCPHCQTIISILNGTNSVLKSWSYHNAFAMEPVVFALQPSEDSGNIRGNLEGFILKIWQWHERSMKLSPFTRVFRRSIPAHNETYHLNQVSETIILITFHENEIKIINVSMTDIDLICNGPDHSNCQPDYQAQRNSLLIADLDRDKSLELVSYYSTYMKREEKGYEVWYLTSKLKVFRLESELPKLFNRK